MYRVNVQKLNGKIVEKQTTREALAAGIGIDRSTLYRRLKQNKLLICDVYGIIKFLELTREEAWEIFFDPSVA